MEDYQDNPDEDTIEENPEYSPKSEFSKAKVVYDTVNRCTIARGKEMKAGYFNTTVTKDGMPIKTWIEDAREIFINSVHSLRLLLSPECKRDEEFKKSEKEINEIENKLLDKFSYEKKDLIYKKDEHGNTYGIFKNTGIKFMPEQSSIVIVANKQGKAENIMGGWDNMRNAYINERLRISDIRFALLNDLIDRLNYFKMGISFG